MNEAIEENAENQESGTRWKSVGDGVYQDTWSKKKKFYHRPTINGKRKNRLLDVRTLTEAKQLKGTLDSDQTKFEAGLGPDPYAEIAFQSVGGLIEAYLAKSCPDKHHRARVGNTLETEKSNCARLLTFWKDRRADKIKKGDCAAYFEARLLTIRKGYSGGRAVDMELGTLCNVLGWAVDTGKLDAHPLTTRTKFRDSKKVRHCRDCMPVDAAELHTLARNLFEDPRSEVLGWQLLLEAMTGCRTSEILALRWDAKEIRPEVGEPGLIKDGFLHLLRAKGGVNPKVEIHPDLADTLEALKQWRIAREMTASPWFIPSYRVPGQPVDPSALCHALKRIAPLLLGKGHPRTSHGLRAYYVTARRSQRIPDAQIAAEIGDRTGAAIIASTYGGLPEIFQRKDAKPMGWAAKEPAWTVLDLPDNLLEVAAG